MSGSTIWPTGERFVVLTGYRPVTAASPDPEVFPVSAS